MQNSDSFSPYLHISFAIHLLLLRPHTQTEKLGKLRSFFNRTQKLSRQKIMAKIIEHAKKNTRDSDFKI